MTDGTKCARSQSLAPTNGTTIARWSGCLGIGSADCRPCYRSYVAIRTNVNVENKQEGRAKCKV
jgi:hypothetical protein